MSNRAYPSTFAYAPDARDLIRSHFEKLGKGRSFDYHMEALEWYASCYLDLREWGSLLPDREHLEEQHRSTVTMLKDSQRFIVKQCRVSVADRAIPPMLPNDEEEREQERRSIAEIADLYEAFADDKLAGVEFLNQMAVRALDHLIAAGAVGSPDAFLLKDGRQKRHRKSFVAGAVRLWATLNDRDVCECTISSVDGSPMLEFIKACLEPLTEITGECAGNETLKNMVNEIKREKRELLARTD